MKRALLILFSLAALASDANGERAGVRCPALTPKTAAQAIIGEAGGETFTTQVAVACALRNRGTLRGVYGVNNPVVAHASAQQWARARLAWLTARQRDLVAGCRYFGCPADAPYFAALGLKPAFRSGTITFYR